VFHNHADNDSIISSLHVHFDAHYCLEVIIVKGIVMGIKRLADELIGTKGIKYGWMTTTTTGKCLMKFALENEKYFLTHPKNELYFARAMLHGPYRRRFHPPADTAIYPAPRPAAVKASHRQPG